MSVETFKILLHSALCLLVAWTCFCRQAQSTSQTLESVRMAFWLLFAASIVLLVAPWGWRLWPDNFARYTVRWPVVMLLGAICAVQLVTARYWHRGTPPAFQRKDPTS